MVMPVPVEAVAAAVVVAPEAAAFLPVPVLAAFPFLAVLVAPAAAVLEATPPPPALIWPFKICYLSQTMFHAITTSGPSLT